MATIRTEPALDKTRWTPTALRGARVFGLSIGLFAIFLFLYTRHNTQPLEYHPDERGKAEQVLGDYRNWRHPAMMLDATAWAVRWFHVEDDEQKVCEAGRWISASFAAGCVVAISTVGYIEAGWWGMLVVGLIVGLCPFLQVHAHYMKEDTGLVLGVGMVLLGTRLSWVKIRSRSLDALGALFLGLACAVCISGKYVGVIAIPVGWLLLFGWQRRWWTDLIIRPILFILGVIGGIALINYRAIQEWESVRDVLLNVRSQPLEPVAGGAQLPQYHTYFFKILRDVVPLEIWLLAGAAVVLMILRRRTKSSWNWVLLALFAGTMVVLSCVCRVGFGRYALPAVPMLYLLAGLGLIYLIQEFKTRRIAATALTLVIVALGTARCARLNQQFTYDSRDQLKQWMSTNLKNGDRVLAENYAGFNYGTAPPHTEELPQGVRLVSLRFAADIAQSLDQLRSQYQYIIVCDAAYERFTDWSPNDSSDDGAIYRREWYQQLFKDGKLVWHAVPPHNLHAYTNPEIRVYRIDGKAD